MPNTKEVLPRHQSSFQRKMLDLMDYHEVMRMGEAGMSTKLISRETGLSPGQVSYRLKRMNLRLSDYRNGKSNLAKFILEDITTSKEFDEALIHKIQTRIKELEIERESARIKQKVG